jgi:hypothetical protein
MKVHDKQRLALYQMAAADLGIQSDKVEILILGIRRAT